MQKAVTCSMFTRTGSHDLSFNPGFAEWTVSVRSGQTIILGGLIDESRNSGRRGIPGVASIPYLGDLLSSTEITTNRTELLVFITPRVVSNDDEAAAVTDEIRRRMELLQPATE